MPQTTSRLGLIILGVAVIAVTAAVIWTLPAEPSRTVAPIAVESQEINVPTAEDLSPAPNPVDIRSLTVDGGSISLFSSGQLLTAGIDDAPAWSTIKVPIAIAALQNNMEFAQWVQPAIEWSSNEAATELWFSLGDQEQAGLRVEELLNDMEASADFSTTRAHFGAEAFGAVDWPLSEQVRFATQMWCAPEAGPVVESMGAIAEEHAWGLGQIEGARFKGGWGPNDETGEFQSRQFGLIPVEGGFAPVAIAATADSETAAREMLDEMARRVDAVRPQLDAVACVPQ